MRGHVSDRGDSVRLPHSKENFYPGLYFYPNLDGDIVLLKIVTKTEFYIRSNSSWKEFQGVSEFWENPSDFAITASMSQEATELIDSHHKNGTKVLSTELQKFVVLY